MIARVASAAVGLVAAASIAGAQQLATAGSPEALDSASAAQVTRIVTDAERKGLPTERIVEGFRRFEAGDPRPDFDAAPYGAGDAAARIVANLVEFHAARAR